MTAARSRHVELVENRTRSRYGAPIARFEVSGIHRDPDCVWSGPDGNGLVYRRAEGPEGEVTTLRQLRAAVRDACRRTFPELGPIEGLFVLLYDDEGLVVDVGEFGVGSKPGEYADAHAHRIAGWVTKNMRRAGRRVQR